MYTIREVSEIMGISMYTLRYYEKIGLLSFVKRDEAGQRQFQKADLVTLNTVNRLKQTGMALKDIKAYLDLVDEGVASVSQRKAIMAKQKAITIQKINELQKALETIDGKLTYYTEAEKADSLAVCHDEREEFMQRILAGEMKD